MLNVSPSANFHFLVCSKMKIMMVTSQLILQMAVQQKVLKEIKTKPIFAAHIYVL